MNPGPRILQNSPKFVSETSFLRLHWPMVKEEDTPHAGMLVIPFPVFPETTWWNLVPSSDEKAYLRM